MPELVGDQNNLDIAKSRKSWLKALAVLAAVIVVFGAGLAVGRGDLRIRGLTPAAEDKAAARLDYSSVDQVYNLLKDNFDGQLDRTKLLDGLKTGLVEAAGDPYTEYFNPQAAKSFNEQLSGSFTGVGAELGTDDDGNIVIISPLAGYPAEKAGLRSKDIISAINGQTTNGLSVSKAVQKIRGPADTPVTLTIIRGSQKAFEVTIIRARIVIPSLESRIDGSIGYLKISQFNKDTPKLARQTAVDFKAKAVKGVVLDLRGNPGGYLEAAINISSLWLDPGKVVVQQRHAGRTVNTEYSNGASTLKGLPTVVLIDQGSASASEITAGALRDNQVATLVGVKSFGKGSVQRVEDLLGGSELKVTVARWYTPAGKNIDRQGIAPDIEVTISEDDKKAGRDPQKDRAYEILQRMLS